MAQQSNMEKSAEQICLGPKVVCERLIKLSTLFGCPITQRNGQRCYGPPYNWVGGHPGKGSELFIGHLPRDCFEDELIPIFQIVAPLYEVRMMLNFSGYNRCYAFVTYCNPDDALKAMKLLHNFEIRPGHKMTVSESIDKCRLFIRGIPSYKTKTEIWAEVVKNCWNVKDVIIYTDPHNKARNRGFLFIDFLSHISAAMAKRSAFKLWNREVSIDWAIPEPNVNPNIMAVVTRLFIRNLPSTFSFKRIRLILGNTIPCDSIQRIYMSNPYCFIHFDTRANAQLAMDKLSMIKVKGQQLEVHWARPKSYRKMIYQNNRSLPPRFRRENDIIQLPQEFLLPSLSENTQTTEVNNNYKYPCSYNQL